MIPAIPDTTRSCFRCGQEFEAFDRERVCPACRKPKAKPARVRDQALTPRERQVIALVRQGMPNKCVAAALHLTEGTVKEYLHSIFRKVGVGNRTELAVWAVGKDMQASPERNEAA